jgi:flavin-dependent dehydrogenase
VYLVGDAGGFADALTGEGIYYALESGRLAGAAAADAAFGRGRHSSYYRRLWHSVLCDTAISYALSKPFFRNVDRGIAVLESPFVWRPLIEGAAMGATMAGSVLKSAGYLVRSWARERAKELSTPNLQLPTPKGSPVDR